MVRKGAGFSTGSGTGTVTVSSGGNTDILSYTGPGPGPGTVTVGTPTNVSYGFIQNTYSGNTSATINIPAFTLTLIVNNVTNGTTASFLGTAAASTIAANSSSLIINWTPNPLTDGTANFTINTPTNIPADTSLLGQASLQGTVTNAVPEPGSLFLLSAGLSGIGFSARKKFMSRG